MRGKRERMFALAGVVFLILGALSTLIFAVTDDPATMTKFKISLAFMIVVPVVFYAFILAERRWGRNREEAVPAGEIRSVIFDVGMVLVDFDWRGYLKQQGFEKEKEEKLAAAIFESPVWEERDQGLLENEEYEKKFVQNAPEYETDILRILREDGKTIRVFDYAQSWVKYLKSKGYRLYILSNFSDNMLRQVRKDMTFLEYMDGIVFSCEVKEVKPKAEIYRLLLDTYGIRPSQAVFLDDRRENIQAAEKLGIHGICFKNFKQAVKELEKLGVK